MRRLLIIVSLLLVASTVQAFRIARPGTYSEPWTKNQVNQLNSDLQNLWNLQNGEFNMDEVETTKSGADNGDFWVLDTGSLAKIQFKSDDTIYSVCMEGAACSGGGGSATPGGSNPQLQYNNAGTFGGVTGSGADANGNVGLGTSVPTQQLELTKNLETVDSTATEGIWYQGANRFLHTFGDDNIFMGTNAGNIVSSGSTNTIIGSGSAPGLTTGSNNVAVGYQTLLVGNGSDNTDIGSHTTAVGIGSGVSGVTAVGRDVTQIRDGNYNTYLGAYTDDSGTSGQPEYSTAIGYNAAIETSNQMVLGGVGSQKQNIKTYGQISAKGWSGVSDTNSGIDFVTFRNSWTSTQTTTDFFDISAVALTTATGLTVKVDNSMTSGRALQILGGSAGATPIFGVDDSISYFGNVTADPCAGDTTKEGGFFYNKTSSYMCFCNSAGADKQAHSPATDCF